MHRRQSNGATGPPPQFHENYRTTVSGQPDFSTYPGRSPALYDSPPPNSSARAHSYYQSISRSTPVSRAQPYEARAYEPAPAHARYTVEEHHDDIPVASWRSAAADKELEDLLASYQIADPSSPHYSARRPLHAPSTQAQGQPSQNYFSTSASLQRRLLASPPPPVLTADRREVERVTYSKPGHPLIELSSPKRTSSLPSTDSFYSNPRSGQNAFQAPAQSISTSYYEPSPLSYNQASQYNNLLDRSTLYSPPPERTPQNPQNPPRQDHHFRPIDISSLEDFLDDAMSKSTNGWRSTFSSMRERFGSKENLTNNDDGGYSFATNGSLTLPRTSPSSFLKKSASSSQMESRGSLLGSAVERKAHEAPELRRPVVKKELSNFWMDTVRRRPDSPTVNRIPSNLTAAERLEQLHEPVDAGTSHSNGFHHPSAPVRRMTTDNVTSRRAQYQNGSHHEMPDLPNFSDLDSAMDELRRPGRNSGCSRFPTGELHISSPPTRRNFFGGRGNIFSQSPPPHSPSPDTISNTSSNYQSLTGLPHPKPKHNIREQLLNAGIGSMVYGPYPGRLGGNRTISTTPNFPAPTSGSVASRISALEKRPGTPNLLQLACVLNGGSTESIPSPRSPMSPRSTVYRTKNVIQVDIGGAQRSPKHFEQKTTTITVGNGHHDVFDFTEVGSLKC